MAEGEREPIPFYMMYGTPSNPEGWREERQFIDSHIHAGCDVESECEAIDFVTAADELAPLRDLPGRRKP